MNVAFKHLPKLKKSVKLQVYVVSPENVFFESNVKALKSMGYLP